MIKSIPPIERFERMFVPVTETGRWLWEVALSHNGYGLFKVGSRSYPKTCKQVKAHRFSYENYIGGIPENLFVCHKCDTPSCVNPSHLFVGTHADNMNDRDAKNRCRPVRGVIHYKSTLSVDAVLSIRSDPRSQSEVAKTFGISQASVCRIKNRQRYGEIE